MPSELEVNFNKAMAGIYTRARDEVGYNAVRFLQMLSEHGGVETAQMLLHASTVSDGYVALWKSHRLDLTVEALILDPAWGELFSTEEREIAKNRLEEYRRAV